jgi:acyl carrier protein
LPSERRKKITVKEQIMLILKENFNLSDEHLADEYRDLPLTGEPFNFSAIQLMYLLLEIEKGTGIRIPEEAFHDYGFSTIEKIIDSSICAAKALK